MLFITKKHLTLEGGILTGGISEGFSTPQLSGL